MPGLAWLCYPQLGWAPWQAQGGRIRRGAAGARGSSIHPSTPPTIPRCLQEPTPPLPPPFRHGHQQISLLRAPGGTDHCRANVVALCVWGGGLVGAGLELWREIVSGTPSGCLSVEGWLEPDPRVGLWSIIAKTISQPPPPPSSVSAGGEPPHRHHPMFPALPGQIRTGHGLAFLPPSLPGLPLVLMFVHRCLCSALRAQTLG